MFENISNIQKFAMDSTNIKNAIIYGIMLSTYNDGATMFPQQITSNLEYTTRIYGLCLCIRNKSVTHGTFPVDLKLILVFQDSLKLLEKTFLASEFGKKYKDIKAKINILPINKIAACMKHLQVTKLP